MKKVLFFVGNRAEEGLLESIWHEFKSKENIEISKFYVKLEKDIEKNLDTVYRMAWDNLEDYKPDLVSCSFDRPEMIPCALAAFYQNIPIFQVHAGDSGEGTHDETVRYLLSQLATLKFCVDKHSEYNLHKRGITDNIFVSGSTTFDLFKETDIKETLKNYNIPETYDMVVLHPNTLSREKTIEDVIGVKTIMTNAKKFTVVLYPNKDLYREEIIRVYDEYKGSVDALFIDGFATRDEYLTVLKHADRVIGNSSSFVYELPLFDKEEIHIGERNRDRRKVKATTGGGKFIANKIMEFLKNDI